MLCRLRRGICIIPKPLSSALQDQLALHLCYYSAQSLFLYEWKKQVFLTFAKREGAEFSAPLIYASARGLIRLRLLRREDTLALNASIMLFISVTAQNYGKEEFLMEN